MARPWVWTSWIRTQDWQPNTCAAFWRRRKKSTRPQANAGDQAPMFKKAAMLAIGLAVALSAETVVKGVKIRFNRSEHDRRLVDKSVDLTFDDTARRLIAKGFEKEVTIAYDDVRKVVFDVTTHNS